eukprot:TRINITY_DN14454_c0_g1_i1.p1 TRINITY_DN14454_c0_g1~~TRINITY_DN14454_c0_g1_i1.p1  ORF type:complete len:195 (+),score=42.52 TRINITY_DN14454_c0_g1_i1:91-675(+)
MAELPGAKIPVWGSYLRLLDRDPIKVKCVTTACSMGLSQASSQLIVKGTVHNLRLVLAWMLWGCPSATFAHWFNNWMVKRHGRDPLAVKLLLDHLLYRIEIMFAFTFYNKLWLTGGSDMGFRDALKETWRLQPGVQLTSVEMWPLLMIVNYKVIPLPLRVLYLNICQFFFCLYLALMYNKRGQKKKSNDAADGK